MTDHHDFGDHHYDDHHDEPVPYDFAEPGHDPLVPDDHYHWADDDHLPDAGHPDLPGHVDTPADGHYHHDDDTPADPEPAAAHHLPPEVADDPVTDFPPAVDVGDLPEPVDGFPWIDTGSLGLVDPAAVHADPGHLDPVDPHELAEYAAADLPPGADPWAALAASDDPATSALARWFRQD